MAMSSDAQPLSELRRALEQNRLEIMQKLSKSGNLDFGPQSFSHSRFQRENDFFPSTLRGPNKDSPGNKRNCSTVPHSSPSKDSKTHTDISPSDVSTSPLPSTLPNGRGGMASSRFLRGPSKRDPVQEVSNPVDQSPSPAPGSRKPNSSLDSAEKPAKALETLKSIASVPAVAPRVWGGGAPVILRGVASRPHLTPKTESFRHTPQNEQMSCDQSDVGSGRQDAQEHPYPLLEKSKMLRESVAKDDSAYERVKRADVNGKALDDLHTSGETTNTGDRESDVPRRDGNHSRAFTSARDSLPSPGSPMVPVRSTTLPAWAARSAPSTPASGTASLGWYPSDEESMFRVGSDEENVFYAHRSEDDDATVGRGSSVRSARSGRSRSRRRRWLSDFTTEGDDETSVASLTPQGSLRRLSFGGSARLALRDDTPASPSDDEGVGSYETNHTSVPNVFDPATWLSPHAPQPRVLSYEEQPPSERSSVEHNGGPARRSRECGNEEPERPRPREKERENSRDASVRAETPTRKEVVSLRRDIHRLSDERKALREQLAKQRERLEAMQRGMRSQADEERQRKGKEAMFRALRSRRQKGARASPDPQDFASPGGPVHAYSSYPTDSTPEVSRSSYNSYAFSPHQNNTNTPDHVVDERIRDKDNCSPRDSASMPTRQNPLPEKQRDSDREVWDCDRSDSCGGDVSTPPSEVVREGRQTPTKLVRRPNTPNGRADSQAHPGTRSRVYTETSSPQRRSLGTSGGTGSRRDEGFTWNGQDEVCSPRSRGQGRHEASGGRSTPTTPRQSSDVRPTTPSTLVSPRRRRSHSAQTAPPAESNESSSENGQEDPSSARRQNRRQQKRVWQDKLPSPRTSGREKHVVGSDDDGPTAGETASSLQEPGVHAAERGAEEQSPRDPKLTVSLLWAQNKELRKELERLRDMVEGGDPVPSMHTSTHTSQLEAQADVPHSDTHRKPSHHHHQNQHQHLPHHPSGYAPPSQHPPSFSTDSHMQPGTIQPHQYSPSPHRYPLPQQPPHSPYYPARSPQHPQLHMPSQLSPVRAAASASPARGSSPIPTHHTSEGLANETHADPPPFPSYADSGYADELAWMYQHFLTPGQPAQMVAYAEGGMGPPPVLPPHLAPHAGLQPPPHNMHTGMDPAANHPHAFAQGPTSAREQPSVGTRRPSGQPADRPGRADGLSFEAVGEEPVRRAWAAPLPPAYRHLHHSRNGPPPFVSDGLHASHHDDVRREEDYHDPTDPTQTPTANARAEKTTESPMPPMAQQNLARMQGDDPRIPPMASTGRSGSLPGPTPSENGFATPGRGVSEPRAMAHGQGVGALPSPGSTRDPVSAVADTAVGPGGKNPANSMGQDSDAVDAMNSSAYEPESINRAALLPASERKFTVLVGDDASADPKRMEKMEKKRQKFLQHLERRGAESRTRREDLTTSTHKPRRGSDDGGYHVMPKDSRRYPYSRREVNGNGPDSPHYPTTPGSNEKRLRSVNGIVPHVDDHRYESSPEKGVAFDVTPIENGTPVEGLPESAATIPQAFLWAQKKIQEEDELARASPRSPLDPSSYGDPSDVSTAFERLRSARERPSPQADDDRPSQIAGDHNHTPTTNTSHMRYTPHTPHATPHTASGRGRGDGMARTATPTQTPTQPGRKLDVPRRGGRGGGKPSPAPATRKGSAVGTTSNRPRIRNALSFVCLAAKASEKEKKEVLQVLAEKVSVSHFVVLLREGKGLPFRALYGLDPHTAVLHHLSGLGPKSIHVEMVQDFYKYDSGAKEFKMLTSREFNASTDAVTLLKAHAGSRVRTAALR
eukprot:Rmarinus@m.10645